MHDSGRSAAGLSVFNDASDARALQIKAEIEAKLANFEEEVSKLGTKLNPKVPRPSKYIGPGALRAVGFGTLKDHDELAHESI